MGNKRSAPQVSVVGKSGFCFGVKRAIKIASDAAKKSKKGVYTLGPLIHNPQVVGDLEKKGVCVAKRIADLDGTVIIRSHGIHPRVLRKIKAKKIKIVDATCPFVKKAQEKEALLHRQGYQVVVVGERDHPEVQGIVGYAKGKAIVINQNDSFPNLSRFKKLGIVAQTTYNFDIFCKLVKKLFKSAKEIKIFNTICNVTVDAQKNTLDLAKKVDLMMVVGGHNSANTSRLAQLCRELGKRTYHIETADELGKSWFKRVAKVGVTAGTSTPNWIIKDVVKRIKELNS